jgi:hypothetical protein
LAIDVHQGVTEVPEALQLRCRSHLEVVVKGIRGSTVR